MQYLGREVRMTPVIVGAISIWESIAITSGERILPTVTSVVMANPRLARGILVVAISGWLLGHWEVFHLMAWVRRGLRLL